MLLDIKLNICILLILLGVTYAKNDHHRISHTESKSHHHHHVNEVKDNDVLDIDERLALEHSKRVAEAGACDEPRLQVIHVSDHYPGRYFLPHCTLLHRCGKHAGCCGTDRLRCVAKIKEKVTLHFYSVRIGEHGDPTERQIEKLTFYNHTKCACAPAHHAAKHDL